MKKKNRTNDVISIPHCSYESLNGFTWSFRVQGNACARSVMLIFALFIVFHTRQSTRNTFLPISTTTMPYTRSPITKLICAPTAWTVLYMETFLSFC